MKRRQAANERSTFYRIQKSITFTVSKPKVCKCFDIEKRIGSAPVDAQRRFAHRFSTCFIKL